MIFSSPPMAFTKSYGVLTYTETVAGATRLDGWNCDQPAPSPSQIGTARTFSPIFVTLGTMVFPSCALE